MAAPRLASLLRVLLPALALACAPMTTQQEVAIGRQAAGQVERQMGLVRDPALEAYVSALGARLAALSPRQDVSYDFHVVDMAEANAFALPGGHIYVSRGLLALTNSEDELANVIGHEIGHVAARHHAQQQARAQEVGVLSALGTLAAGVLGGSQAAQAAGELGQVAGASYLAAYSRDQERQADEIGQTLAARGGWSPAGMGTFLDTLGKETALETGGKRNPSFLDTHPATPERVQSAAARAKSLVRAAPRPIAADRAAFFAKLNGLGVDADPAGGVFDGPVFLHPDFGFRVAFPAGWRTANSASAVGAAPQDRGAVIQLQLQGTGSDARAAAQQALAKSREAVVREAATRVGGLGAYEARLSQSGQQGRVGGLFTWVALGGRVFRIECIAPESRFEALGSACRNTVASFRPLDASDRASIRNHVLRIVTASSGETVAALTARSASAWSAQRVAIANGLDLSTRLERGRPVKVVVAEPYRPRR